MMMLQILWTATDAQLSYSAAYISCGYRELYKIYARLPIICVYSYFFRPAQIRTVLHTDFYLPVILLLHLCIGDTAVRIDLCQCESMTADRALFALQSQSIEARTGRAHLFMSQKMLIIVTEINLFEFFSFLFTISVYNPAFKIKSTRICNRC